MNKKVKNFLTHPLFLSIVAALFLVIVFFWGTVGWLSSYTNHGEELVVPDLEGMDVNEAANILHSKNLRYEINDSLYVKGEKPGAIVEQNPAAGSKVKEERKIYLIVNARSPRKVPLPDLRDISVRQGEAMLRSVGLKVADYEYVPSEYKDLIQDVKYGSAVVLPGTRITEGTSVVLLVGQGLSSEEAEVESFRGLTLEQAIQKAHSVSLNIGAKRYDAPPKNDEDEKLYVVYKQEPITKSKVSLGQAINLFLTKDKTLLDTPEEVAVSDSVSTEESDKDGLWQ